MGTQTCQVPNKEEIFLRGDEHRKKKKRSEQEKKTARAKLPKYRSRGVQAQVVLVCRMDPWGRRRLGDVGRACRWEAVCQQTGIENRNRIVE
jgi:hypothetical protein